MSLQKKLNLAYEDGCNDTADVFEAVVDSIKGIGEKKKKLISETLRSKLRELQKEKRDSLGAKS